MGIKVARLAGPADLSSFMLRSELRYYKFGHKYSASTQPTRFYQYKYKKFDALPNPLILPPLQIGKQLTSRLPLSLHQHSCSITILQLQHGHDQQPNVMAFGPHYLHLSSRYEIIEIFC